MASSILPATSVPPATSGTTNSGSSGSSQVNLNNQIAGNFTSFLQLLTTQLKNQNPLDPLDTNQFTQQLVEFAGVEQQMNMNTQLQTLVSLQQTAQSTQALGFVGASVVGDGATTKLSNHHAQWSFSVTKPSSATVTVTSANGETAYSGTFTAQAGPQSFAWDGRGNDGKLWPDGTYRLTVTAKDASGQTTAVSTEATGVVDSVDLTQNPPILSIGGQDYTLGQIKRVTRPAAS
jgi:flagellar basal-body rod modification protein FlgD